ncbi:MAG: polysaccharide deacetylase family protein [Elusimicrobia bacterium]|nr:polysaccharide deacetylase family protein [Elusimicrobiota bacterium]
MSSIPVLMYHHVSADREVTPQDFEAHLLLLKRGGFRTVGLDELYEHLSGNREIDGRAAMLTFDDGYADNWICAYPLLKKHGMRAVVFPVTQRADEAPPGVRKTIVEGAQSPDTLKDERGPAGFLSWDELKVMSSSGVFDVGSHTHTHRDFKRHTPYEDLKKELALSRARIEERIGTWKGAISWPWGDCEPTWAGEAGYRMAFTTRVGANVPGLSPFSIRRFKVRGGSCGKLAFRLWLYRRPLLAELYGRVRG